MLGHLQNLAKSQQVLHNTAGFHQSVKATDAAMQATDAWFNRREGGSWSRAWVLWTGMEGKEPPADPDGQQPEPQQGGQAVDPVGSCQKEPGAGAWGRNLDQDPGAGAWSRSP